MPSFVPDSATGVDRSVGGLGMRDTINSGSQLSSLQLNKRVKVEVKKESDETIEVFVKQFTTEVAEENEDQCTILAGEDNSVPVVKIIPLPPLSGTDTLKQDMQEPPNVTTDHLLYEGMLLSAIQNNVLLN